jgi:hypothetical protein
MIAFHQIQALGKEAVDSLCLLILDKLPSQLPKNYLQRCSLIYQAYKKGDEDALLYVKSKLTIHQHKQIVKRREQVDQLNAAFAL